MSDEIFLIPAGMQATDKVTAGLMGRVEIKGIIDDPGAPDHGKVVSYHASNVITFDARKIMARALAGEKDGLGNLLGKIVAVAWGSGSSDPARAQTQLDNQLRVSAVIEPVVYPNDESVIFSSTLPPNEGTGEQYSEVGLIAANGMMFARFKFPTQFKFDRLRLTVNWQVIFV